VFSQQTQLHAMGSSTAGAKQGHSCRASTRTAAASTHVAAAAGAGFDVWLPNTRGNTFSRGNFYYSHRQPEYWYHGVDEYALIDNPAMVDKVLQVSGASKLAWVGHSQVRWV
jgi:predicted alpha/beta hydrolase